MGGGAEEKKPGAARRTSLLERAAAGQRRAGSGDGGRRRLVPLVQVLIAGLAIAAAVVWLQAGRLDTRARALDGAVGMAAERGERLRATAAIFAAPTVDERLIELRRHVPPEIRLVAASVGDDRRLAIVLDTPDPDALRQAMRADGWLARFREQAQTAGGDGTIRVTLEEAG